MSAPHLYIIAYDIADARRWRRVFKLLKRQGEHHQYSVFLCRLSATGKIRLERQLNAMLDLDEDKLLIADLGQTADRIDVGGVGGLVLPFPRPVIV